MNGVWLRQDPVLRALPRWFLWSLATTLLLLGLAVNLSLYVQKTQGRELSSLVTALVFGLVLWLPALVLLLSRASRIRCSHFDLSLPLTTEHLWRRHLVATVLSGALLMLAIGGIAALVMFLMTRYTDTSVPMGTADFLRLTATLVICFALAATLVQSAKPAQAMLPASRASAAGRFLTAMGTFALAVLWMQLPLLLLALPLLGTWLLARWAGHRLPTTWSLETDVGPPGDDTSAPVRWEDLPASARTWRGPSWQVFLLRTIHSGTPKAGMTLWIGVPLLLGFGAILAGAFSYMDDDEIRWTMFFITIYMLFALVAKPLAFLRPFDALPISRRHLFALLTLPSFLFLALGYGAGRLFIEWRGLDPSGRIRTLQTCAGVGVPTELHSISWNGQVEPVVAPWGESHRPFTAPLIAGLKPVIVSRFCTRDSNVSMEFQVFQASLAAEALYDQPPPPDKIRSFLTTSESVGPRTLEVEAPPRMAGEKGIFPLVMAIVCMGTFVTLALYLHAFRVGRLDRVRKVIFVGILGILLALHMGQFLFLVLRWTSLWAWDVLWKVGTSSLVAALPGGTPTLWLLAAVLVGLTYRLAERQFERAELPWTSRRGRC